MEVVSNHLKRNKKNKTQDRDVVLCLLIEADLNASLRRSVYHTSPERSFSFLKRIGKKLQAQKFLHGLIVHNNIKNIS